MYGNRVRGDRRREPLSRAISKASPAYDADCFRTRKNESVFPQGGIQHQEPRTGGLMSRLRILQAWIATAVLSTGVAVVPGMAAGSTQTFTGKVSDAMCGAKHTEAGI